MRGCAHGPGGLPTSLATYERTFASPELPRRHHRGGPRAPAGTATGWSPASRPSRTATCTSATPSRSSSTSAWPGPYGGRTHLRFDDTNPVTEDTEYVESIQDDVRWLGGDWGKHLYYASDYFEQMYECAERLVREGKAYVDSQTQEPIREQRGCFERPGVNEPVPRPHRRRRASTSSAACGRASSRTAPACSARASTWRTRTCSCAIRCSTGSATPTTTAPATPGASTRCTTTPIRSRTRSRASPTPSARWSSSRTASSTTGCSTTSGPGTRGRASTSSPGWRSATR